MITTNIHVVASWSFEQPEMLGGTDTHRAFWIRRIAFVTASGERHEITLMAPRADALSLPAERIPVVEANEPECIRCGCTDKPLHEGYCPECCR